MDGNAHVVAGGLLVPPVVNSELLRLESAEQFHRNRLDALYPGGVEIGPLQQVEDGKRLLVQPLADMPRLLLAQFLHEFEQVLEGFFDVSRSFSRM